jgi:hypothetical protein
VAALAVALGVMLWLAAPRGLSISSVPPVAEQFRRLNHLVTLQVPVTAIHTRAVVGYTGSINVVVLVRGDVQMAVDLDEACFASVDDEAKTAVLTLPLPKPRHARLDHRATQVYRIERTGLWMVLPVSTADARAVSAALAEAQGSLDAAVRDPALVDEARCKAQDNLARFFGSLGWTIEVRWVSR